MLELGFLERDAPSPTVAEVLSAKKTEEPDIPDLITIASHQKVGEAIDLMQRYWISQLPVVRDGELDSLADVIGSLQDRDLLDRVFKNPDALHENVAAAMQPPLAAIDADEKLDEVFSTLTGRTNAVVVARAGKPIGVLTRTDLLEYLAHRRATPLARATDETKTERENLARLDQPTFLLFVRIDVAAEVGLSAEVSARQSGPRARPAAQRSGGGRRGPDPIR